VVGKRTNQSRDKTCADYVRSYVRGFITVYTAWFLGVDVEDGFWTTYFKPLERLWSINRAQKDISLMRGEGLVDKDRLRLTEEGWECMEEAIAKFLKGEFNGINIIKEYPETVLVAPGFALEHGIDLVDIENELYHRYEKLRTQVLDRLRESGKLSHYDPTYMEVDIHSIVYAILGEPELRDRLSVRLFQIRYRVIDFVKTALVQKSPYPCGCMCNGSHSNFPMPTHSRWLIPLIPYLINMEYSWQPARNNWFRFCTSPEHFNRPCYCLDRIGAFIK